MVPFSAYVIDRPSWTSAPETWGANGKISHASDIWMMGIALWELLCVNDSGDPFALLQERTQIEEVMKSDGLRPVPLDWTDASEPIEFRKLVEDCCSLERKQRPTIDDVLDRLASLGRTCNQECCSSLDRKPRSTFDDVLDRLASLGRTCNQESVFGKKNMFFCGWILFFQIHDRKIVAVASQNSNPPPRQLFKMFNFFRFRWRFFFCIKMFQAK